MAENAGHEHDNHDELAVKKHMERHDAEKVWLNFISKQLPFQLPIPPPPSHHFSLLLIKILGP